MRRIAVDLTPVLPGGENGGAKLMTIELIRNLSRIFSECEFLLLTSERSNAELASLDAANVRRLVVNREVEKSGRIQLGISRLVEFLPAGIKVRLSALRARVIRRSKGASLLTSLNADLLFCPFTAPFFYDPEIPSVSVVYDLQHIYYPQFFTPEECYHRDKHFKEACRLSKRVICISDYVRDTVIKNGGISPQKVRTVYIRLSSRLPTVSPEKVERILNRFQLISGRFLLFPANFWAHKNHQMLFTSFGMYCAKYLDSDLKLVCTGVPGPRMEYLEDAAKRMRLAERIVLPGYLSDEEYAVLICSCKAVIFPSLYEGFGMPVTEAMVSGKPVLCSDVTSLPEVAGEAALYFDPKRPQTIVNTIERLEHKQNLTEQLIERGHRQAAKFNNAEEMAREYWQVFREAIESNHYADHLHGVHSDGWCSERVHITYRSDIEPRRLEVDLSLPPWFPVGAMRVTLKQKERDRPLIYRIERGQLLTIRFELSIEGGFIELSMDRLFQPKSLGIADDTRLLGCLCQGCRIVSSRDIVVLHETGVGAA